MEDERQHGAAEGGKASDELASLRAHSVQDAAEIARLRGHALEARQIERAQQALIARLRQDAAEADERLESIGDRLARAEHELSDLRAIRDALSSPALLQRPGMTLAAELLPAASQVGGDFFFVGDGPAGAVVAVVGDVVGKGLTAARRAAFSRTAFASVAPFSDDPCRLLELVNVALVERIGESADFVTAICISYNPGDGTLRAASAGHPAPLRLDTGHELPIPVSGRALGLAHAVGCSEAVERVSPGTGVLLYTDGLTEARGQGARYGVERTAQALREHPGATPTDVIARLVDRVHAFAGPKLTDDICVIALRTEE